MNFIGVAQAVASRGVFGALGPNGDCWPQMAGVVPLTNNEVFDSRVDDLKPYKNYMLVAFISYKFSNPDR